MAVTSFWVLYTNNSPDKVTSFIAEGDFGTIYRAMNLYTRTVVVAKVFHKGQLPYWDIETEDVKLVAGCSANIQLV